MSASGAALSQGARHHSEQRCSQRALPPLDDDPKQPPHLGLRLLHPCFQRGEIRGVARARHHMQKVVAGGFFNGSFTNFANGGNAHGGNASGTNSIANGCSAVGGTNNSFA